MPPVAPLLRRSRLILFLSLVAISLLLAVVAAPAVSAATQTGTALAVTATRNLSVTGQAVGLIVEGPAELLSPPADPATADPAVDPAIAPAAVPQVVVRLYGPLALDQVGKPAEQLPEPRLLDPTMKAGPAGRTAAAAGDMVVMAVVPPEALTQPGAYLATVVYSSGGIGVAEGSTWFGRMAAERGPLEMACVWPLAQGVHRNADGVFFDDWLERALVVEPALARPATPVTTGSVVAPASAPGDAAASHAPGRLWDVLDLAEDFPDWRFTLAIEPILLTQLGEMADGYSRADPADPDGAPQEVGPDDETAASAGRFLDTLKTSTASGHIGVAAAPYAGPSAAVLSTQEWSDGVGQMRLGRQVVQQVLPLVAPVVGAYSPDMDLCTESLSSFSDASIDHVLVDAVVAKDLVEPLTEGAVTARASDRENERLTLILADSELRSLMAAPWDAGLFCAGLAARVTAPAEALVLAPAAGVPVPPLSFMQSLGDAFAEVEWLQTVTLDDLIGSHPPGSRPVLLNRPLEPTSSYIGLALLDSITEAHAAVDALAQAAGPSASAVGEALLLVYTAESRWWSLPQTSPQTADVGLDYALRAQALAEGEFEKMRVVGVEGTTITGNSGEIQLLFENQADYPVSAEVILGGTGLTFPDGAVLSLELPPGKTGASGDRERGSRSP